jgi:urease accessory protein
VAVELSIMNTPTPIRLLWLLQLSDTALPIGALNHSFGLETLTAEESLGAEGIESFLADYLREVSALEIHFCGAAYRLGVEAFDRFPAQRWLDLNTKLSAFKLARESRIASATLGRRLIRLVCDLERSPILFAAIDTAQQTETDIHHCAAFGLAGAALGIEEHATVLAYGHQSLANLISACQRLLPVGQAQATRMLWELKPVLTELVTRAQENDFDVDESPCFAPLAEVGSMRHPSLRTRLFIS